MCFAVLCLGTHFNLYAQEPSGSSWGTSLKANINFGQTSLTNWSAASGNTVSNQIFIDGKATYKKADMFWDSRLQIDYGFVYTSSMPILQKSDDRIYFETEFGYKSVRMKNVYLSASYDFRTQFSDGYEYNTPNVPADKYPEGTSLSDLSREEQVRLWKGARNIKSGFLSPAYTNLALGVDFKPFKGMSVNITPLTGGYVIVLDKRLRMNYGMELKQSEEDMPDETRLKYNEAAASGDPAKLGEYYNYAKFEFGAQIKADYSVEVRNYFAYTTQFVAFSDYLDGLKSIRMNWDNRFDWKLGKLFSITFTADLLYDNEVMIYSVKDELSKRRVQFREAFLLGFTYTISKKKNN